eukprot:m.81391 g.81391  ORF g.81391 m.81391 type:complete len:844 (-) comp25414_c0_seq1:127-2658(-)
MADTTVNEPDTADAKVNVLAQEALQGMRRDINCLGDTSKMTRKRAIGNVRKQTLDAGHPPAVLQILMDATLKPLLKLFADPTEKCRELSVELITDFTQAVTSVEPMLPYIVPVITSRLGQSELIESSEEVRLLHMHLIHTLLDKAKESSNMYLDDYLQVFVRTTVDPFPDVKRMSCECIVRLAEATPIRFKNGSKVLHKPLIATMQHQHSKVRAIAIRAVEAVCLHGEDVAINDFMVTLAQKSMDSAPNVRKALYNAVGTWMLELKDRYSFWYKLLTLMLNGINDEVPEIQELCTTKFHMAGKQWEGENEKDVKDQLDFGTANNDPARPLGCRILVEREFSKILPGLLIDICDWTVPIRLQSAGLLLTLLTYCEDKATMHFEKILTGLVKSARDEDEEVAKRVVLCVEVCGRFTEPQTWTDMILPRLSKAGLQVGDQIAHLIVMGGLIRGGKDNKELSDHLLGIVRVLSTEAVSGVQNKEMIDELFLLVDDVLDVVAATDCLTKPLGYFTFVTMVNALAMSSSAASQFAQSMMKLAKLMKTDVGGIYEEHLGTLLDELQDSHTGWTTHSFERIVFETALELGGEALGDNVEVIMEIFFANFNPEKDHQIRLSFFALLAKLLNTSGTSLNSTGKFCFARDVVEQIVVPNCVWTAGRIQAAIRTSSCLCMWALLKSGLASAEDTAAVIPSLLPQMVACLDDDYSETRHTVCKVLEQLLIVNRDNFTSGTPGYDQLHTLYPELLKRLDDNSDDIRLASLKTWLAFAECMAHKPYNESLYQAHAQAMFKGLLIHLDDSSETVQIATGDVLAKMGQAYPSLMRTLVIEARTKHRATTRCDLLLEKLPS